MKRVVRRFVWFGVGLGALLALSAAGGGFYVQRQLQQSLPQLSGTIDLPGLEQQVTVDRDRLGIPAITAASRVDAARALGFVHAQDRFFQMDLQRRQAAGELSALVGARALEADKNARVHRFRHISRRALERTSPGYRAIVDAYAAGVNAGLASLDAAPIEYHVLRVAPEPWTPEDTILTVLAMFNTLQGRQPQFEATFGSLRDSLPLALYQFLTAPGSEWDAPITGGQFTRPAVPEASVFDLRAHGALDTSRQSKDRANGSARARDQSFAPLATMLTHEEAAGIGSNNWAVAGAHTATGAALVANDMHLGINVPNIWYRASLTFADHRGETATLTGVTLPGLPSLVVGSNGHVAWGFTNTGGDWSDLITIDPDPRSRSARYLSPHGSTEISTIEETIAIAGAASQPFRVRWTEWGPIVGQDHRGRDIAQRWVAHDPEVLASDITAPERARTVEDALTSAAGLGMPAQNFVAGDTGGHIGWTIAGPIPRRVGFNGSYPTSWADGTRRWDGYLTADEFPRVIDPPGGRIWTANSAVVDGEMLAAIGEGGYADGIRARIIRDRLNAIERATPADMLSIQLDTSALFHERWRALLLSRVLTPSALADARRAEFKRLVETSWTGRADPESVGYRLVRSFRSAVSRSVYGPITQYVRRTDPDFDFGRANRAEGPLWQLVTERPVHLLAPRFSSWDALLVSAVDEAIRELTTDGAALDRQTWGAFNRAIVTHPLGSAIPLVGPWVNMPDDPLPGDVYTPRAHSPRTGPSERMAVSPGREHEGILHMPTGQSGHPLSAHYNDQHRAWVEGTPLAFLPGETVSRLVLRPIR